MKKKHSQIHRIKYSTWLLLKRLEFKLHFSALKRQSTRYHHYQNAARLRVFSVELQAMHDLVGNERNKILKRMCVETAVKG